MKNLFSGGSGWLLLYEKTIKKASECFMITNKEILRQDFFVLGWKSEIPPSWNGIKTYWFQVNVTKVYKEMTLVFWSCLLSLFPLHGFHLHMASLRIDAWMSTLCHTRYSLLFREETKKSRVAIKVFDIWQCLKFDHHFKV